MKIYLFDETAPAPASNSSPSTSLLGDTTQTTQEAGSATTTGQAPTDPVTEPTAYQKFIGSLPEEHRGNKVFEKYANSERPEVDIAVALANAQKFIGNDPGNLVDKASLSTPEARVEFLRSMGAHDDPAGYELKLPDGAPKELESGALMDAFKDVSAKAGLLPEQAQAVYEMYAGIAQQAMDEQTGDRAKVAEQNIAALKQELGPTFEDSVRVADLAVSKMGGEAVFDKLAKAGLSTDPDIVKMFIKIGGGLMEDTAVNIDGKPTIAADNAIKKAKELRRQAMNEKSPRRKRELDEEAHRLYQLAHGQVA